MAVAARTNGDRSVDVLFILNTKMGIIDPILIPASDLIALALFIGSLSFNDFCIELMESNAVSGSTSAYLVK